jgi:metal-sulfur cluster biosynthetic enzyme
MTENREILHSVQDDITEKLKTVYDPEFPLVDLYTMGLIYDVHADEEAKSCVITMTITTPACPMADMLIEMVKNAVLEAVPAWEVEVVISFEPMWTPKMIKDEDLQRMFE